MEQGEVQSRISPVAPCVVAVYACAGACVYVHVCITHPRLYTIHVAAEKTVKNYNAMQHKYYCLGKIYIAVLSLDLKPCHSLS